jgi:DNA-binding response OmpR family regulator
MKRILLLENDADLSLITRMALEGAGYDVAVTATVAQAIGATEASEPDLAVVDLLLDSETGWDYVRWLRQRPTAPPIAAYSVHHDDDGHMDRAEEFHVEALIPKTGDPADLLRAIAELLS